MLTSLVKPLDQPPQRAHNNQNPNKIFEQRCGKILAESCREFRPCGGAAQRSRNCAAPPGNRLDGRRPI